MAYVTSLFARKMVAAAGMGIDQRATLEGAGIDPDAPWFVDRTKMEATADNTPFDRQGVQGRVKALIKGGVRIAL